MKSKLIWIGIIIAVMIVIGGNFYMDRKDDSIVDIERESLVALKNTFEDISSVVVERASSDKKTGTYGVYVSMTTNQDDTLDFMYNFEKGKNVVYGFVIKDKNIQKRGVTKNEIKVKLSNGSEEII